MNPKPYLINGKNHVDERGKISFTNLLDLNPVKRFYYITPKDTSIVRAWQGHQGESKWFHVISGEFLVRLVKVDNWITPSKNLKVQEFLLIENDCNALFIPPGYANGFKSTESNSCLLVFSDKTLRDSIKDDFRFDKECWWK